MGKVIRVTPEQLEQASKKLAEYSQTYTQIYQQLMQEANTMGTAWEGEDNLAFVNQITGFTEELRLMASKLQTASEALNTQRMNYKNRQEANISQVRNLAN
ncbi:MAG: WXG100 family type VII secretion target [Oscillospiraceae bacterium]|jgi:WXG100 family type VII secretion target|nr:WXG100 family type VII secretion target [Oscillospiraceae bacterium]